MTKHSLQVREFMVAAKQELPDKPTIISPKKRFLRASLILEEAVETALEGLGVELLSLSGGKLLAEVQAALQNPDAPGGAWVEVGPMNLVKLADGNADLRYVVDGTDLAAGIDGEPVSDEVHASNMSKFTDGHWRDDGKFVKGPSYRKADIASIIAAQQGTLPE